MVDERIPIRTRFNYDGKLVRVLLIDDWYDTLKPWIDRLRLVGSGIAITEVPDAFERIWDVLTTEIGEFSIIGWTFTIGVLAVLAQVVHGIVSLGKFTYETLGGLGTISLGNGPLGASETVIKEFPVEG